MRTRRLVSHHLLDSLASVQPLEYFVHQGLVSDSKVPIAMFDQNLNLGPIAHVFAQDIAAGKCAAACHLNEIFYRTTWCQPTKHVRRDNASELTVDIHGS